MAGVWDPELIYALGDVVTYNSTTFTSSQNFNLNNEPSFASEWWTGSVASGVASVTQGTNITVTGTPTNPIINTAAGVLANLTYTPPIPFAGSRGFVYLPSPTTAEASVTVTASLAPFFQPLVSGPYLLYFNISFLSASTSTPPFTTLNMVPGQDSIVVRIQNAVGGSPSVPTDPVLFAGTLSSVANGIVPWTDAADPNASNYVIAGAATLANFAPTPYYLSVTLYNTSRSMAIPRGAGGAANTSFVSLGVMPLCN
jgi:hypothetical protein